MKDFRHLIDEVATPFAEDKFYELPQHLASWVEKKGRKKILIADGGSHWIISLKGDLNSTDLGTLAVLRIDSISTNKNKLVIEVRK